MEIPAETRNLLFDRFDPELLWLVGTTCLSSFVELKPGDTDIIVTDHSLEEILDAFKDLGVKKKKYWKAQGNPDWTYGIRIEKYNMDVWPDDVYEYLEAVPFPVLRGARNLASDHTLVGKGFPEAIRTRTIEIPDSEPRGRMVDKSFILHKLGRLARRTRFRFGPKLKNWAKGKQEGNGVFFESVNTEEEGEDD